MYTETLKVAPLVAAVGFYVLILVFRSISIRIGLVYFVLGVGAWVGLLKSGVDPVVIGLAIGILPFAFPAERSSLERATERFREFREQPTAELARVRRRRDQVGHVRERAVTAALSPVDELRDRAGVRASRTPAS